MISKILLKTVFSIFMKGLSTIVWILLILSAYGGRISPFISSIPATLSLALPYIAGVSFLLLAYWVLRRKLLFSFLGVGAILVCLSPLSQAFPISFRKKTETGDTTFKVMTWNIHHTENLRDPDDTGNASIDFLRGCGADVICLQEMLTFSPTEVRNYHNANMDSLFAIYPYHAGGWDTDVKILSKYPVKDLIKEHYDDSPTRYYFDSFRVDVKGHPVTFVVVHLTSYNMDDSDTKVIRQMLRSDGIEKSMDQYNSTLHGKLTYAFQKRDVAARLLRGYLDTLEGDVVVCGDFNDVPASWVYRLVKGDDFHDAYTETGFGPTFTFNKDMLYFHIDQILYKGEISPLYVKKGHIKTSDHYPLTAEFKFDRK